MVSKHNFIVIYALHLSLCFKFSLVSGIQKYGGNNLSNVFKTLYPGIWLPCEDSNNHL